MRYRPLSFTKNLGGLKNLHSAIRHAYSHGVSVSDFAARVPANLKNRVLIIEEFFLATRVSGSQEIIVDDALISETLERKKLDLTLKRLYFFSLVLNMPGQRRKVERASPAAAQNEFVRAHLHDGKGWVAERLDKDRHLEPWVAKNMQMEPAARRKFCNNFYFFFEQCEFPISTDGYIRTFANHWGPAALRLFFDRYTIDHPNAGVDDLADAAREREIHKLLGMPLSWLEEVIDGAAIAYVEKRQEEFVATEETTEESEAPATGPVDRRTKQVDQLVRSSKNKRQLEDWYKKVCQICQGLLPTGRQRHTIDYAHIRPLGAPHNGPDQVSNMLSMCPNHHRQFDRGAIAVDPDTRAILAPHGSTPKVLAQLHVNPAHKISRAELSYHKTTFFKP